MVEDRKPKQPIPSPPARSMEEDPRRETARQGNDTLPRDRKELGESEGE
jgi:hypothetical protein